MNGLDSYNFQDKNQWRKSVWDEIKRRIPNASKRKDAIILYLAGEEDLDRENATQRGFRSDNMIACEINKHKVDVIRSQNKNVIEADLIDVINSWPLEKPNISIIIADFCSGLEPGLIGLYDSWGEKPSLWDSLLLINLLRGRDARTNQIRQIDNYVDMSNLLNVDNKHRGYHWLMFNCLEMIHLFRSGKTSQIIDEDGKRITQVRVSQDMFTAVFLPLLLKAHKPRFWSYKSGIQVLDSVLIETPIKKIFERESEFDRTIQNLLVANCKQRDWPENQVSVEHKIRASLAIRTMKLNGQISHSPWK